MPRPARRSLLAERAQPDRRPLNQLSVCLCLPRVAHHQLVAVPWSTVVGATPMALVAALAALAIYPDDHWKSATKLTTANFESFVTEQVDAGKTLFVRWIASAG